MQAVLFFDANLLSEQKIPDKKLWMRLERSDVRRCGAHLIFLLSWNLFATSVH